MINELLRRILFLPPQASSVAREVDYLHYFVILTTMAGAAAITVVGLAMVIRYRARSGEFKREDPAARPPLWAEAAVVGGLLSLFCLWWVIGFSEYVEMNVPPQDSMRVYVTGKQWMWKFAYPDGEHTIATLYVPAGRPVELLLTSRDVIHSFYVPDFRIKQDAVPGRYTTAWFTVREPGTHLVLCAEYCGTSHSSMRAQVIALAPEDYARWLAGARRDADVPLPRLVDGPSGETAAISGGLPGPRGDVPLAVEDFPVPEPVSLSRIGARAAGELGCLRCHTLDGSAHIGPTWAGLYRSIVPLADGTSVVADEAYLTESMMDPQARLHAGFQPVMPSYHGLMTPAQTAAVIELIKAVREVPGRGTPPAPLAQPAAGRPAEPAAGEERAGAMGRGPVETVSVSPTRPGGEPQGTEPPARQQGLPPAGLIPYPAPRLPIRVVGPGARPVAGPETSP
jgi:cytochrome c oxidase subunit 2